MIWFLIHPACDVQIMREKNAERGYCTFLRGGYNGYALFATIPMTSETWSK